MMKNLRDTKTVIVAPQLPIVYKNGGIGTFNIHFANLLVSAGYKDLTIIYTSPLEAPFAECTPYYAERGIKIVSVLPDNNHLDLDQGYTLPVRISEITADLIPDDTDLVYFADFRANGLIETRRRRFRANKTPTLVTVIHGPSEWHRQGQSVWPSTVDEILIDFSERYVTQHSDFVAAPSSYVFEWARQNSWKLPPEDRLFALGYPLLPASEHLALAAPPLAHSFKRVVFFGRLETRKGIDLFIDALAKLKHQSCLDSLEEIVLLGINGVHKYGQPEDAAQFLEKAVDKPVKVYKNFDTSQAQNYLRENAADSLVVMPSRSDTFGFTIIECSLIPGLNFIHSNVGGMPDVLGEAGKHHLFEPSVRSLAERLQKWLEHGPRPTSELGRYDWQAANQRWIDFHEMMCRYAAQTKNTTAPPSTVLKHNGAAKSVDVCIPYYNLGKYLPFTLDSLAKQTTDDFNIFVVNDGSSDTLSTQIYDEMKQKYEPMGWHFVSQPNQGVCAARNLAASLGEGEYLIFMDADNIAAPKMIERFLESIRVSQDDCLTCWMSVFKGDGLPKTPQRDTFAFLSKTQSLNVPIGNYPVAGILSNPYGDLVSIMRRDAFEAVGGFTMDYPKDVNQEDRELLTRLSLEGYKMDVIPEILFFYRHREDSRLRTTDLYLNEARVLRVFEKKLETVGLEDLIPLVIGQNSALQNAARVNADSGKYRSEGGITFPNQHEYLVNGVPWVTLLKAISGKITKNLKRLVRR